MAMKFDELVNGMVNISFGVAATAAEKGKEVLEDLNAKGEQVRRDPSTPDFARSMSDIFEQAGGAFTDATDRLNSRGEATAERILDELILARVRMMAAGERAEFVNHVRDLVATVDDDAVHVPVESVEVETGEEQGA